MAKPKTKEKSVPMRYYNSAFIKKVEYAKLLELKKKCGFKSMSALITDMRITFQKVLKQRKNIK